MTVDRSSFFAVALAAAVTGLLSTQAGAHCDGMDGPVVRAAQAALAKRDVDLVSIWVPAEDEPVIRRAFERTLKVRESSPEAKELADTYFFETLVRIHRAAEGAPFTGLKPGGRDLGPAIPAADRALASGDAAPLVNLLVEEMRTGLLERHRRASEAKAFRVEDVEAGREYVEAYVTFIHYVEAVHEAATRRVEGHYPDAAEAAHHQE
jgi:hypothetical protein